MGALGSFISGVFAGAIALGALSWAASTFLDGDRDENGEKEGE